jgi:hypothetical protein
LCGHTEPAPEAKGCIASRNQQKAKFGQHDAQIDPKIILCFALVFFDVRVKIN